MLFAACPSLAFETFDPTTVPLAPQPLPEGGKKLAQDNLTLSAAKGKGSPGIGAEKTSQPRRGDRIYSAAPQNCSDVCYQGTSLLVPQAPRTLFANLVVC